MQVFFAFAGSLIEHKIFFLIDANLKYRYYHMREYYGGFKIFSREVFSYANDV